MFSHGKHLSFSLGILLIVTSARGAEPRPQVPSFPIGSGRWRVDGGPALLRYAPDGKTLLVLAGGFTLSQENSGGSECVLHRLDAADGRPMGRLEATLSPSFSSASASDAGLREPALWCISPDGCLLAAVEQEVSLRVRELDTGRVRFEIDGNGDRFSHVRFSPDGRRLAAALAPLLEEQPGAGDGPARIRLWDAVTGKEVLSLHNEKFVPLTFTFAPDGRRLAVIGTDGGQDAVLRVWDLDGKKDWRPLAGHRGPSDFLTFSPDGKRLAEVNGKKLRLWDPATGKPVRTLAELEGGCTALAFAPDGKRLLVSVGSVLRQWDLVGGRELDVLGRGVGSFTFAPDGRTLALTVDGDTIRLVALEDGKEIRRWQAAFTPIEPGACFQVGRQGAGWPVAFAPDGRTLAAATSSGLIRRWSVATGKEMPPPAGLDVASPVLAVSPDGKLVAAARWAVVTLWDVRTGALVRRLPRLPGQRDASDDDWPTALAYDPHGKSIAAAWQDGGVTVWDVAAGGLPPASWVHQQSVGALGFAEEGAQVVSAAGLQIAWHERSTGRQVRLWSSGARPGDGETALALSPPWTVVTGQQEHHTLWELATGKARRRLDVAPAGNGQLSPDGRFLLASRLDALALVDLDTGKEVRHLWPTDVLRTRSWIRSFAFSPDGKRIAAAHRGGVDVWDAASASPLCHLTGHRGGARAVAFMPDGELVSAGEDLTLLRWDLRSLREQPPAPELTDAGLAAAMRPIKSGRDDLSEPLPAGALARLGSQRFQHDAPVGELRYLPGGLLLTSSRNPSLRMYTGFSLWDAASGRRRQAVAMLLEPPCRGDREGKHGGEPSVIPWCVSPDGRLLAITAVKSHRMDDRQRLLVQELATDKTVWEVTDAKADFRQAQFSPDGKRLAILCRATKSVRLHDAAGGHELCRLGPPQDGQNFEPTRFTFAPDGGCLAVLGKGKAHAPVCIYDTTGLRPPLRLPEESLDFSSVSFTPDGRAVAMVSRPQKGGKARLRLWDAASGKLLRDLGGHNAVSTGLVFSPDGKLLASQRQQQLQVWDAAAGKLLFTVKTLESDPTALFSPDGRLLAVARLEEIRLYEPRSGKLLRRLCADPGEQLAPWTGEYAFHSAEQGLGRGVAFSGDGKVLASAYGQTIRRWDPHTGKEIDPLANDRAVSALAVSADGHRIAVASAHHVVLWEAGGKVLQRLRLEAPPGKGLALLRCVALSPDGTRVAAGSSEGDMALWEADGTRRWQRHCHDGGVATLDFVDDGRTLFSTGGDRRAVWHEVEMGRRLRQAALAPANPEETSIHDASDLPGTAVAGGRLLARGQSGVQLWELAGGKQRRTLAVEPQDGPAPHYPYLALSANGRLLAVRVSEDCILLVDIASGKVLRACGGLSRITSLALSPDGRLLAAAGLEGAFLWETANGSVRARLTGHRGPAAAVAFSADGRTLATGGEDSTVLVWDVPALLHKPPTGELSRRQLAELWGQLAGKDAAVAYDAARRLARHPAQAVPLVSRKLPPVPEAGPRVARLIVELDDSSFAVRERASKELSEMGAQAEPALRKALKEELSLELRRRIEMLLEHLRGPATSPEELRALRAVEMLEWIGSDDARRVLEGLAGGAAEARLTRTATSALWRLKQRRPSAPARRGCS